MSFRPVPILAEYIPPKVRRFWRRLPPVDIGELPRDRLGERRVLVMAAKDAPPPTLTSRGRAADTADPLTTDR